MDIAELHAFIAVAETRSFSTAAERLFLTQPAVSKRIAALESELAVPLFDRIGRQVALTEAGDTLLPRARRIVQEITDSKRALADLRGQVAGRLQIGTSHHIGLHRLPPVLREYTAAWPEVELDIEFMDSEDACQAVQQGRLELGIVTLPSRPMADLEYRPLWPDPLAVFVAPDHPLAHCDPLTPQTLADHPAILPAHGTYTRERIEAALAPHHVELQISMATNYLETIKMMVSVGLGWSILPVSMQSDDVAVRQLEGVVMQRELGVVWHRRRTRSNAARAMLECLENQFRVVSSG
ncbi:MAG TPA: LysR family transcriptional regulator [Gammaproteobacteria bacterium]|nr:LysR family transcriptional regulator [Gammaproteobacteria bacterium]